MTVNTKFFYLSHILGVEHITLYTIDTFFSKCNLSCKCINYVNITI